MEPTFLSCYSVCFFELLHSCSYKSIKNEN